MCWEKGGFQLVNQHCTDYWPILLFINCSFEGKNIQYSLSSEFVISFHCFVSFCVTDDRTIHTKKREFKFLEKPIYKKSLAPDSEQL